MKQKHYIAGLYYRLSQEDERQGESVSIDNQRTMLRKYAEERGFEVYGEYIDDGVSGTTFQRPEVQRLLDDAKTGVINTIIVKDLSRFGRNYIEVGQYVDYVFPAFGIRFIAIQDNVDTENREEAAPIVRRIFELYVSGISPKNIADILNAEGIPSPGQYAYEKLGHKGRPNEMRLWCEVSIRYMVNNIMYLGHLAQLQETTISYKNHKRCAKDKKDWIVVHNNHEPIISQELWDKAQERQKHMAQGRRTKTGFVHPLSGFLVCADCGNKLKMSGHLNKKKTAYTYHFDCGIHLRYGKTLCFSHYISAKDLEEIVLDDIRTMAQRIVLDEENIKNEFIRHNAELADKAIKTAKKELQIKHKRTEELSRLMQLAYEDRLKGKMPEDICVSFIRKYSEEQKRLEEEIAELETKLNETENTLQSADDFIRNIKKYLEAPTLTREMCYELLDRVVVGGLPKITGKEREIDIVYKVDIASVLRHKFKK